MSRGLPHHVVAELARARGGYVAKERQMDSGEYVQTVHFPDHVSKIGFFADLAREYAKEQEIQAVARSIVGQSRDRSRIGRIVAIHSWVRDNITHIGEPIETVPDPVQMTFDGCGDCDDSAVLLSALLMAIGERAGLGYLGTPPRHAAACVELDGQWYWLETTIDAVAGEHPLDAAERLGIQARKDLTG